MGIGQFPPLDGTLVRVVGSTFVAGFVVKDDRVVFSAPYLRRWLMNLSTYDARAFIAQKGWRASIVRDVVSAPLERRPVGLD